MATRISIFLATCASYVQYGHKMLYILKKTCISVFGPSEIGISLQWIANVSLDDHILIKMISKSRDGDRNSEQIS